MKTLREEIEGVLLELKTKVSISDGLLKSPMNPEGSTQAAYLRAVKDTAHDFSCFLQSALDRTKEQP